MQSVVIDKRYFDGWYMPLLRFGRGKKNERKMGLFIKGDNDAKVSECHAEISKFIGKDIGELVNAHDEICLKFNDYTDPLKQ